MKTWKLKTAMNSLTLIPAVNRFKLVLVAKSGLEQKLYSGITRNKI